MPTIYAVIYGYDYGPAERVRTERLFLDYAAAKQCYDAHKHGTGPAFYCVAYVYGANASGELVKASTTAAVAYGDERHCLDPDCAPCAAEGPPRVDPFPAETALTRQANRL